VITIGLEALESTTEDVVVHALSTLSIVASHCKALMFAPHHRCF
jgi:hypothetical protein